MEINKDNDLIEWFWEKFNSCYLVKHEDYPERLFMFYDPQYIRKLKLANISGEKINKTEISGVCLFEQDWKNNYLYCNFDEIWDHLYYNYSTNSLEIHQFIKDRLEEHSKMSVMTPLFTHPYIVELLEHSKMSVLTPKLKNPLRNDDILEEHSKMSVLTRG